MSDVTTRLCTKCGASIYSEHLDKGIAGYFGGKLLCSFCLQEAEKTEEASTGDLETIALVDEPAPDKTAAGTQIRMSSETQIGDAQYDEGDLNRELLGKDSPAASRCRTFHAKLNEGAISFMNRQINEWVDSRDDLSIKFATSTIGIFEGKKADPHLIVTVFY